MSSEITIEPTVVWPDRCPDCNLLYPRDSYEDDEAFFDLFIPAGLFNCVGSPGTGKSYTVNAIIWKLLHNRLCEYWGVVNFRYSRYTVIREQTRIIEGHEVTTRIPETEQIPVSQIHPRIVEISNMVHMVTAIAKINQAARERKVAVRIMVALDEAPLSAATGAKGSTVSMTATSLGMNQLVTISRKLNFGLFLISLDESLLQRKMRSSIQGEEGTIKGLVRCVISKDPQTVRAVAKGLLLGSDGSKPTTYRIDDVPFKKLVAFLPQVPGWAPSLRMIGKTPLSCSVDEAVPGDTTFETLTIGGLEVGKIGGLTFDVQHFINRLVDVPPEKVPDACLKYLEETEEESPQDTVNRMLGEQDQSALVAPPQTPVRQEPKPESISSPEQNLDPRERKTLARAAPIFERYTKDEQTSFTDLCKLAGVARKTARKFQRMGLLPRIPTQPEGDDE